MSGRFASRAAVVTGAGQGIGREIARQLAREGASVLLNDRDEALAREAARAIEADGGVASAGGGQSEQGSSATDLDVVAVGAQGQDSARALGGWQKLHSTHDSRPHVSAGAVRLNRRAQAPCRLAPGGCRSADPRTPLHSSRSEPDAGVARHGLRGEEAAAVEDQGR